MLFSEFVFDLPGPLPAALADVPCASEAARPIIEELCERLAQRPALSAAIHRAGRGHRDRTRSWPSNARASRTSGSADTFPFEERTFLAHAIDAYLKDDIDAVRQILDQHQRSVWTGKGETQAQWELMRAALELTLRCEDLERQLREPRQVDGEPA